MKELGVGEGLRPEGETGGLHPREGHSAVQDRVGLCLS